MSTDAPPVARGKLRICVHGMAISHNNGRAQKLAQALQAAFPDRVETWFAFPCLGPPQHWAWVNSMKHGEKGERFAIDSGASGFPQAPALMSEEDNERFCSRNGWGSPFVWVERAAEAEAEAEQGKGERRPGFHTLTGDKIECLGGCDRFREWVLNAEKSGFDLSGEGDEYAHIRNLASTSPSLLFDVFFPKVPGSVQDLADLSDEQRAAHDGFWETWKREGLGKAITG